MTFYTFRKSLLFNCSFHFYLFVSFSCFVCHIVPESVANLKRENSDLRSKVNFYLNGGDLKISRFNSTERKQCHLFC